MIGTCSEIVVVLVVVVHNAVSKYGNSIMCQVKIETEKEIAVRCWASRELRAWEGAVCF